MIEAARAQDARAGIRARDDQHQAILLLGVGREGEDCPLPEFDSRRYLAFCRARGLLVYNVFVEVLDAWARAGVSGRRARLAKHPGFLRSLAGTVAAAGLEPNVYSVMR